MQLTADVRFLLFPVEYGQAHLLIKEIEKGYDWEREMSEGKILMWTAMKESKQITHSSYSYGLLGDDILKVEWRALPMPGWKKRPHIARVTF